MTGAAVLPIRHATISIPVRRAKILFLLKFFLALAAGYAFFAWRPINDHVVVPFTAFLASIAGSALHLIGEPVRVVGTEIAGARFGVNVNNGCNGIEAMLILLAAIVAVPASLKARAAGLLIGIVVVQVLNQIRIVTLYLLGAYQPRFFEIFHTAVWQVAVIGAAVLVFVVWSARVAPPRLSSGA